MMIDTSLCNEKQLFLNQTRKSACKSFHKKWIKVVNWSVQIRNARDLIFFVESL